MITLNAYTVSCLGLVDRSLVPDGWRVSIVSTDTQRMRWPRVSITRYELRAYDPGQPSGRLRRTRTSGYQPLVLAARTSGSGAPQWMRLAEALLNGVDPDASPMACPPGDRSGRYPEPLDTPLEEWARGVDELCAEVAESLHASRTV